MHLFIEICSIGEKVDIFIVGSESFVDFWEEFKDTFVLRSSSFQLVKLLHGSHNPISHLSGLGSLDSKLVLLHSDLADQLPKDNLFRLLPSEHREQGSSGLASL